MVLTSDASTTSHIRYCPECGGVVEREHRHALDRWVSLFRTVHRYRCANTACNWHGLMGRLPEETRAFPSAAARLLWFSLGAAASLAVMHGLQTVERSAEPRWAFRVANTTPPGIDFDGVPMPESDDLVRRNPSPMVIRSDCAWGTPGRNPYKGTVELALAAMQLPPEVVRQVSERAARGDMTTKLQITRNGIRSVDGSRLYSPQIRAMAFGGMVCMNMRVNFKPGHMEFAPLYEVADRSGRVWSIMIPDVCQNVSVLGERGEVPEDGHSVPEPATWALVALGLGLLALGRRRRAGRG